MEIKNMKVSEIHPYERNPRFNDEAVDTVAASIKEFGWNSPIVVDKDMVIICGHTRLKAALKLGLTEVPVYVAEHLTPEQVKAYRIEDNKSGEIAEWNFDLVKLELLELQGAGYDLKKTAFNTEEIDRILNGGDDKTVTDGETEPDAVPEIPEKADSVHGTCYQLGDHILLCGDSTKRVDIEKLMPVEKADLYLVDPPYNVALTGSNGLTIQNDNMDDGKFAEFLNNAFACASFALKEGGVFYIWHGDIESVNFRLASKNNSLEVHETLYWIKPSFNLGRHDYHYQNECCLYGWKSGASHNWYSDRKQSNCLHFDKPKHNDVHPSMKPVEMMVYCILNSSKKGDIVLDNFGGRGSTLIACEQTGRKCRMIELDEKYCDVIRRRWAEFKHGEGCDWKSLTPAITNKKENLND